MPKGALRAIGAAGQFFFSAQKGYRGCNAILADAFSRENIVVFKKIGSRQLLFFLILYICNTIECYEEQNDRQDKKTDKDVRYP